ncbi:MAG: sn-glycerol-1-phosphate dehydrogenase [Clostridia bacterium]|nr:sn-glycerol-1-phosphate dehydrogenase [Clostridia bacterium]
MYGITVEYKNGRGEYPALLQLAAGKRVLGFCDLNTHKYLLPLAEQVKAVAGSVNIHLIAEDEPIPDEAVCEDVLQAARDCELLIAAGSGTLNDINKYVSFKLGIPCATLATAPSMDGYVSGVSALMTEGKKVTLNTKSPEILLVDCDILACAPPVMVAAGIGDVVGKYNCLLDWKMAHLKNGEAYNRQAVSTMLSAVDACMGNVDKILSGSPEGARTLIDALITSGYAMVIAGNSRPASGGEHHTSHYLEMDFARRGERIPLHGLKVALGTMVCIRLYNYLLENKIEFNNCREVYDGICSLPTVEEIRGILVKLNAPCRYRDIGVSEELLREMLMNAYTVRERYTVLTLFRELGLMERVTDMLVDEFF